jgi:hypothetical protein
MTKINSPEQLPEMLSSLEKESFYGEVHLTFRKGALMRIVTEESQVFNPINPKGRTFNGSTEQRRRT